MKMKKVFIVSRGRRLVCIVFSFYVVQSDGFPTDSDMAVLMLLLLLLLLETSAVRCRENVAG
jgi:hypothetical protein